MNLTIRLLDIMRQTARKEFILIIIVIASAFFNGKVRGESLYGNTTAGQVKHNVIENAIKSTFSIKNGKNSGTGFFISPSGYAITCRHVLSEDQEHIAVMHNQVEYPIGIIASSETYDLALIMVLAPMNTPFLHIRDSASPDPGERIYTIKGPMGYPLKVISGINTGLRRKEGAGESVLQFSAPVNPGDSGGPMIDMHGEVVGVVSWKIVSKKGIPVYGEVFAVPSKYIREEYERYFK